MSLQRTLAKIIANNGSCPAEVHIYNKQFLPSLIDSIIMVRVARKRAVRSFLEMNSRNFFACFKRLYQISDAEWAIRVHPNDDCWERDNWEYPFSPSQRVFRTNNAPNLEENVPIPESSKRSAKAAFSEVSLSGERSLLSSKAPEPWGKPDIHRASSPENKRVRFT